MNQQQKANAILVLGSLEVFTYEEPVQYLSGTFYTNKFYWRDAGSPQGYGPFNSIFEAMSHYAWVAKNFKSEPVSTDEKLADVIRVDFKNRTRVNE